MSFIISIMLDQLRIAGFSIGCVIAASAFSYGISQEASFRYKTCMSKFSGPTTNVVQRYVAADNWCAYGK